MIIELFVRSYAFHYLCIGWIEDIPDFFQEVNSQFTSDNSGTTHHHQS